MISVQEVTWNNLVAVFLYGAAVHGLGVRVQLDSLLAQLQRRIGAHESDSGRTAKAKEAEGRRGLRERNRARTRRRPPSCLPGTVPPVAGRSYATSLVALRRAQPAPPSRGAR